MKSIQKITAVLLAFLVMLSTFTFAVEKHYCGDFLIDVSYLGKAKSCNDNMPSGEVQMKNCCKDELHQIDGQDELQQQEIVYSFEKQVFVVAFVYSFKVDVARDTYLPNYAADDPPPLISKDVQVEYQTFLL